MSSSSNAIPDTVVDQAITWMMVSREGMTDDETDAFGRWLATDLSHRLAWDRLAASFDPFRVLESQQVSGQDIVASLASQRASRREAIIRGVSILTVTAATAGVAERLSPLSGVFADYSTATGQRRSFALPDGSALTLNARSQANLAFDRGGRGIVLENGMVFANVKPLQQVFTVTAGTVSASLRGGPVIVSREKDECRIICQGAGVDVHLAALPARALAPYAGLAIGHGTVRSLSARETENAASWLEGKLLLHDRPFGELIDAFRPYRSGLLSISAEAARLRISGVFDLDHLEDLLKLMPDLFSVRVLNIGPFFTRIEVT